MTSKHEPGRRQALALALATVVLPARAAPLVPLFVGTGPPSDQTPQMLAWLKRGLALMPPKAYRWIAEMHEIADFVGEDPAAHELYVGAAHFYEQIARDFEGDKEEVAALEAFMSKGA